MPATRAGRVHPAVVVGRAERARPRHRISPRTAARTARRDRPRLQRALLERRARVLRPSRRRDPPRELPRPQHLPRRDLRRLRRPSHAGGGDSVAHARRGDRRARVRGRATRSQGRGAQQLRRSHRARRSHVDRRARARQRATTTTRCGNGSPTSASPSPCTRRTQGLHLRQSSSRYMFNHIGNFAASSDAFAKALVFGGAPHRFPALNFGFLECGVAWGVQLLFDLIARWEKRGGANIERSIPSASTSTSGTTLVEKYGGDRFADDAIRRSMLGQSDNPPAELDDFRDSGVRRTRRSRRAVRSVLLRLRSRRRHGRLGVRGRRQPTRRGAPARARLRHRPLGRSRHARGRATRRTSWSRTGVSTPASSARSRATTRSGSTAA